ncbi:MAG: hypothetical protein ACE5GS_16665 [Kiloniellaceae bacterium]
MLRSRAEEAAKTVFEVLKLSPSTGQSKQVADAIERAMIDAYRDSAERCAKVASECCSEDRDMAHKIYDEIRRANTALIANLSSLR